jgi:predicted porin
MKKFALLVALLASIGLAQADVGIVGTLDGGYSSVKAPGSHDTTNGFASGGMTTSYFGVKGSEDLGGGNSAVFDLTSFVNEGNGATMGGSTVNLFARTAYVGIDSVQYGKLSLGRQNNPSFMPTILFNAYGDSGTYGPLWHATYFGNTGNPDTQIYNDTAWDNSVTYRTPNLYGATAAVYSAKGTTGGTNTGANVIYFKGDLGLTAYYQKTEVNSTGSFQTNIFGDNKPAVAEGVGASYDLKVAKLFATYQEGKDESLGRDGKTTQVSALIPVGKGNVMAEYAQTVATQTGVDTHFKEYAVGYDYNLSKKTDVYATFGRTSVTAQTDGQTVGTGIRVRF